MPGPGEKLELPQLSLLKMAAGNSHPPLAPRSLRRVLHVFDYACVSAEDLETRIIEETYLHGVRWTRVQLQTVCSFWDQFVAPQMLEVLVGSRDAARKSCERGNIRGEE
ncbi:hypothetical protein THAOC_36463 [Thalassiosira oceanica]|uniref:Uncharacterized protein n=1 Tax=Thalassiosira oceanica TaxID=159749 RepID=K0R052_THAOC|nr:hypothetical protein THAOC_36463 [Thalassiosira oceanica]|eukprot:EJK44955.1 hypothetical protein THAOC_36463 [Thalassiosira oceanica]